MSSQSEQSRLLQQAFSRLDKKKNQPQFRRRPHDDFWASLARTQENIVTSYTDREASWGIYGENFRSHLKTFSHIFDVAELNPLMQVSKEGLVVVDALGPGGWIKEQLHKEDLSIKKGFALTLSDERPDFEKIYDEHTQKFYLVPGNVFSPDTVDQFLTTLKDEKIDFLMCRPYGGLSCLPLSLNTLNAVLLFGFIHTLYEKTKDNGILLFQTTSQLEPLLKAWDAQLNSHHQNMFTLDIDAKNETFRVFKLIKKTEDLPALPLSQIRALFRERKKLSF
ncbi:MAG TPA: hypothetical protein VF209_00790 [Patescibacteria group bacterium]